MIFGDTLVNEMDWSKTISMTEVKGKYNFCMYELNSEVCRCMR